MDKQVKTRVKWRDTINYSVLCNENFTNDCFEEGSTIAAQVGTQKRRCLKPDIVSTTFNRTTVKTASGGS